MFESWWRAHELDFIADGVILAVIGIFGLFVGLDWLRHEWRRKREWERMVDRELRKNPPPRDPT